MSGITFPGVPAATTLAAVRDRAIATIAALTPGALADTHFSPFLDEGDGNFRAWCLATPNGSLRRFQVSVQLADGGALVTNGDYQQRLLTMTTLVAYPQTARSGKTASRGRADLIDLDRRAIEGAIGLNGRLNFSSAQGHPDACWTAAQQPRTDRGRGVDFLVLVQTMMYVEASATFTGG